MSHIILASIIAFILIAGVAASPIFSGNLPSTVYAQNPEIMSDNSTTMSGNMTSGNETAMTINMSGISPVSGNTTSNDTTVMSENATGNETMMSGTISGKGRG